MAATTQHGSRSHQVGRVAAIGRAVAAAFIMAFGLVASTELSGLLFGADATAASGFGSRVLVAGSVTVIVVGLILLLRRRWDRRTLTEMGLTGPRTGTAGFAIGFGVLVGAGVAVLLLLDLTGVVTVLAVDPLQLLGFVATNAVVALLLEALPEELAIRGYALTNLRDAFPPAVAVVLNICAFLLVAVSALALQGLIALVRGNGEGGRLAPSGEDPIVYYTMLVAFGYLLIYARDATASATIWTAVGAHLGWLTMNRIVLGAEGVQFEMDELGLLLFFAGYATVSIVAFSWLRRASRRSSRAQRTSPSRAPR